MHCKRTIYLSIPHQPSTPRDSWKNWGYTSTGPKVTLMMDAGERVGLMVLDKLDVYSLYASRISSNNSPDDSSESGVDVVTGFLISGGRRNWHPKWRKEGQGEFQMKWTGCCHKKMKNQPVSFWHSLKLTYYVSSFLFWMMMDSIVKLEMRGVLKMM